MAAKFSVRVSAGKGNFSISLVSVNPLVLKADVPAEPVAGKANRMLLSELERMLSCRVQMLAGHTSRRKTLVADCDAGTIIRIASMDAKQAKL